MYVKSSTLADSFFVGITHIYCFFVRGNKQTEIFQIKLKLIDFYSNSISIYNSKIGESPTISNNEHNIVTHKI